MNRPWLRLMLLPLGLSPIQSAWADPPPMAQLEINHLLTFVAQSGCEFYRNGSWYDAKTAEAHIHYKYDYLVARDLVSSAEDFIDESATKSSFSGEPYAVKCNGRDPVASSQWLRDELARYRALQ